MLQASDAGVIAWSENTGPRCRADTRDGRCGETAPFSQSPLPRSSFEKKLGGGGGVYYFLHQNHLSENILPVIFNCVRFPWPNKVGGYMKGVS